MAEDKNKSGRSGTKNATSTDRPTKKELIKFFVCDVPRNRKQCSSIEVDPNETVKQLKERLLKSFRGKESSGKSILEWFDKNDYEWRLIDDKNLTKTIRQLQLPSECTLSIDYVASSTTTKDNSLTEDRDTHGRYELILKLCLRPMDTRESVPLKINALFSVGDLRKKAYEQFHRLANDRPLYQFRADHWIQFLSDKNECALKDQGFQSNMFISLDYFGDYDDIVASPGLCGLSNLGNTCFMNSSLQCLSHVPAFAKTILALSDDYNAPILCQYIALMKRMWSGYYRALKPDKLLQNIHNNLPRYTANRQQDAQEFLNHFLHLIHDELTCDDTFIKQLFYGKTQSQVTCLKCQQKDYNDDSISFLPLPLNNNEERTLLFIKANGELSSITVQTDASVTSVADLIDCVCHQQLPEYTHEQLGLARLVDNDIRKQYDKKRFLSEVDLDSLAVLELPSSSSTQKYGWCEFFDRVTGVQFRPPLCLLYPKTRCRYRDIEDQMKQIIDHLCSSTHAPHAACYLRWFNTKEESSPLSVEASADEYLSDLRTIRIEMDSRWVEIYQQKYNLTLSKYNSSLMNLLSDFFREDRLHGLYYCQKCAKHTEARHVNRLCLPLPPVLIIQLKRFVYDVKSSEKIDTFVSCPLDDLDLKDFIVPDRTYQSSKNISTKYNLVAVANHRGDIASGHYTTYAKYSVDGHWYCFNDSTVEKLKNEQDVITRNAYILVYTLKTTK